VEGRRSAASLSGNGQLATNNPGLLEAVCRESSRHSGPINLAIGVCFSLGM
jgi:hypothetical protein